MSDLRPALDLRAELNRARARVAELEFTLSSTEGHRQGLMANVADLRAQLAAAQARVVEQRKYLLADEERAKLTGDALYAEGETAEAARHVEALLRLVSDLHADPLPDAAVEAEAWLKSRGGK